MMWAWMRRRTTEAEAETGEMAGAFAALRQRIVARVAEIGDAHDVGLWEEGDTLKMLLALLPRRSLSLDAWQRYARQIEHADDAVRSQYATARLHGRDNAYIRARRWMGEIDPGLGRW